MSDSKPSIIETRRDQIFPHLDATDIERARRFGEIRRFAAGEALAAIGQVRSMTEPLNWHLFVIKRRSTLRSCLFRSTARSTADTRRVPLPSRRSKTDLIRRT
jgi:hypothetical protein